MIILFFNKFKVDILISPFKEMADEVTVKTYMYVYLFSNND